MQPHQCSAGMLVNGWETALNFECQGILLMLLAFSSDTYCLVHCPCLCWHDGLLRGGLQLLSNLCCQRGFDGILNRIVLEGACILSQDAYGNISRHIEMLSFFAPFDSLFMCATRSRGFQFSCEKQVLRPGHWKSIEQVAGPCGTPVSHIGT